MFAVLIAGCGYPTVAPETYEIAKALHTVVNAQDAAGLEQARAYIDESLASGSISDREHELLGELIATAEAGEWEDAEREVRTLLADQND